MRLVLWWRQVNYIQFIFIRIYCINLFLEWKELRIKNSHHIAFLLIPSHLTHWGFILLRRDDTLKSFSDLRKKIYSIYLNPILFIFLSACPWNELSPTGIGEDEAKTIMTSGYYSLSSFLLLPLLRTSWFQINFVEPQSFVWDHKTH